MVGVKFVERKNFKTPRSKKIEKIQRQGTDGRGRLSKYLSKKMKGVGANGRIHRKKYKRFRKSVTF